MPALDQCHDQVVRALQKDGWTIEDSPFRIQHERRLVYIDLRVSSGSNGSRQTMICVEVKCFADKDTTTTDLYISIGQYILYRAMLLEKQLPYPLYLVVPHDLFKKLFDKVVIRAINDSQIKILVVDVITERIVQWIE